VLEQRALGIAEVKRQVLDDEQVVGLFPSAARELVVLEPYAGVGVPVVPRHIGRSPEARGELHTADVPAKGSRTSLVRGPAALAVAVAVMATPVPTVVVVARVIVAVVVDTLSSSSSLDRVPGVTVGPESIFDRGCCGSDSLPTSLVLGRRQIRAMGKYRSSPTALRALA
jgi:hypothetical protein